MSHLEPARIMALGLEPDEPPTVEESAHLRSCHWCAEALAAERELSRALAMLPLPEAPVGLAEATEKRFAEVLAARRRQALWSLAASLTASFALGVSTLLLAVMCFRPLLMGAVALLKEAAVVTTMARSLVVGVPPLAPMVAAMSAAAVIFAAGMLARLARETVVVAKQ